jgi:probable F420-dependent oxidoreductase
MDFGLTLPGIAAEEIPSAAQQAEQLGYKALYVPDHWAYEHQTGGGLNDEMPAWDSTSILAAIAGATKTVRIGALVLCNLFRHPATTALATSTLDHLSGGRAFLGLGSGWTRAEFEMMGAPFPDVKPRLRMLDEALQVIRSLWTRERTTFEGEFYRLKDAFSVPKPAQKPHPPILLGGSGKGLLRIAARHADVVNVVADTGRVATVDPREVAKVTDAAFRGKLDFLRAEIQAAGRDVSAVTLSSTIFIAQLVDDRDTARSFAEALGSMFGLPGDEIRRTPLALIGTSEECIVELRRREREWGITHYVLSARAAPGFAERFAREIMPNV